MNELYKDAISFLTNSLILELFNSFDCTKLRQQFVKKNIHYLNGVAGISKNRYLWVKYFVTRNDQACIVEYSVTPKYIQTFSAYENSNNFDELSKMLLNYVTKQ